MMFLWHHALWLLLALPALVGVYLLLLRRKQAERLRYPGLGLPRESASRAAKLRAHVPSLLLLAGVAALLLAVARPVFVTTVPSGQGTVVLLMDVSLSMAASDVPPTRLAAARAAAVTFVHAQPRDVRVAVVAFGGYADIVQPPTANRKDVLAALDRLELQRFTAIGNGLIGALVTILPGADYPQGYDVFGMGRGPAGAFDVPLEHKNPVASRAKKPVAPGSYLSAAIILVSDGLGTMGVAPAKAAKMLADAGIRVYTVGVGTLYGGVANVDGWPTIHAEFSEDTLREIAHITRGEYFLARDAHKLERIYEGLRRRVVLERTEREVTVLFAALGMILSLASAGLSLWWPPRAA
jgi:Ca-activated chloride channel family protein